MKEILVQATIEGSILAVLLLLITNLIKNKCHPKFMYYIWFILIIKLIIPMGPESKISIFNISFKAETAQINASKNFNTVDNKTESLAIKNISINNLKEENKDTIQQNRHIKVDYSRYGFAIWIIVSIVFILRGLISYVALKINIKKEGEKLDDNKLNLISIKNNISIILTDKVKAPMLFGVINPKILIPNNIYLRISDEELKFIIAHELVHYKRRDTLIALIIWVVKSIYWFNPIIIIAMNSMKRYCEISCDAEVIKDLSLLERVQYGNTIINTVKYLNSPKNYVASTGIVNNKKEIKERIERMSKNKKISLVSVIGSIVIVILLAMIGLTSKINSVDNGEKIAVNKNLQQVKKSLGISNVVVYNNHNGEKYSDDTTVVDAGKMLEKSLKSNGIDTEYMSVVDGSYQTSYERGRAAIINGVEDFENSMIIDIHSDSLKDDALEEKRTIKFALAESCPRYTENKTLVDMLVKELENEGVETKVYSYPKGNQNFNLDLSSKALLVEVGNPKSNKEDIEYCINKLSTAIKNIV